MKRNVVEQSGGKAQYYFCRLENEKFSVKFMKTSLRLLKRENVFRLKHPAACNLVVKERKLRKLDFL